MRTRKTFLLAAVGVAASGGAAGILTGSNSVAANSPADAPAHLAIKPAPPATASVNGSAGQRAIKAIRDHYGVFRRAETTEDRVSHDRGGAVRRTHAGPDGKVFLRAATGSSDDSEAGDLCVIAQVNTASAGAVTVTGCGSRSAVATTPVIARLAFLDRPDIVAGPTPDGVQSVVLHSSSGEDVEVPVANNAYVALLDGDYVGATFNWRDGRQTMH